MTTDKKIGSVDALSRWFSARGFEVLYAQGRKALAGSGHYRGEVEIVGEAEGPVASLSKFRRTPHSAVSVILKHSGMARVWVVFSIVREGMTKSFYAKVEAHVARVAELYSVYEVQRARAKRAGERAAFIASDEVEKSGEYQAAERDYMRNRDIISKTGSGRD